MDTIGVVCEPDHPVFGRAAERLAARGFEVTFLPAGEPVPAAAVGELDALATTVVGRHAFAALRTADRRGVETWNGFLPATALASRLVALEALERVGCRVPDVWLTRPDVDHVPRRRYRWDRPAGGMDGGVGARDDTVYVERVRAAPVTHRYYAVDDGVETHVQALTVKSELSDCSGLLGETEVDVELATRVRELLDRFGARAVGVDFVPGADGFYAVDATPTPSFFAAGLDRNVADSLASLTTIGA